MNNTHFKLTFLIFLFLSTVTIFAQELSSSKYYFLNGEKVYAIQKSNDTLYTFKCNSNFECSKKPRDHYKILRSKHNGNRYLFEVEKLVSLRLTINPIPDERFQFIGFERTSENAIKIMYEAQSFTEDSIAKIPFELNYLDNKFGFTYYTENYLKSFKIDYIITSDIAKEIIESCKSYTEIITQYKNTKDWRYVWFRNICRITHFRNDKTKFKPNTRQTEN